VRGAARVRRRARDSGRRPTFEGPRNPQGRMRRQPCPRRRLERRGRCRRPEENGRSDKRCHGDPDGPGFGSDTHHVQVDLQAGLLGRASHGPMRRATVRESRSERKSRALDWRLGAG
jgi:hypothetical protein